MKVFIVFVYDNKTYKRQSAAVNYISFILFHFKYLRRVAFQFYLIFKGPPLKTCKLKVTLQLKRYNINKLFKIQIKIQQSKEVKRLIYISLIIII